MVITHVISGLSDGGAESVILFRLITQDSQHSHYVISLTTEGKYGSLLRLHGIKFLF